MSVIKGEEKHINRFTNLKLLLYISDACGGANACW